MPTGSRSVDDDLRALTRYQHDIFISYSRVDEPTARDLFSGLARHMVKPFFAPIDLIDAALTTANQWVGVLRQALERSCHYAGLVSPHFLATPWCELELRGFMNLTRSAPARCIQLFPVAVDVDQLQVDLKKHVVSGDLEAFQVSLVAIARSRSLQVGDLISPFPPRTFRPLPLREKHRLVAPWGKDSQTPGGHPAGAPYIAYEECVREVMVQILRGAAPNKVMDGIHDWPWHGVNFQDVRNDALDLLRQRVSPFAAYDV